MLIQLTFSITIFWLEDRLYFKNLDENKTNFIDTVDSSKMWIPLDYVEHKNAVIGKFRPNFNQEIEIIMENFVRPVPSDISESREEYIYRPYILKIKQRFRVDYECIFDLQKYPFDEQLCNIILKFRS